MSDWVNEWTELKTPLRVMKVPRMGRRKVPSTRLSVQSLRTFLRSCTIVEWMKAVAVSQGRNDAFSTGSQAQYPPQPRTAYAHQEPRMIPTERKVHGIKVQRRRVVVQASPSSPRNRAATAIPNGIVIPT